MTDEELHDLLRRAIAAGGDAPDDGRCHAMAPGALTQFGQGNVDCQLERGHEGPHSLD